MRISDWSSDVCSSDLGRRGGSSWDWGLGSGIWGSLACRRGGGGRDLCGVGPRFHGDLQGLAFAVISNAMRNPSPGAGFLATRSEEHTSELQSLMRNSYAVFCLKKKNKRTRT